MGEVIHFNGITKIDEPPESVLEKAKLWGMTECIVIGLDGAGDLVFGGSIAGTGEIMLLLEAAKQQLIENSFSATNH